MGEIIRTNPDPSRPIHLIGIAPWGCISGVEQLDVDGTNVIYAKSKSDDNNKTPLEPNHTQFILIDDGTKHQDGGEFAFRARFERSIAGEIFSLHNNQQDSSDTSQSEGKSTSSYSSTGLKSLTKKQNTSFLFNLDSVPVVLLVIDGGRDTIRKGFHLFNYLIIFVIDLFSS